MADETNKLLVEIKADIENLRLGMKKADRVTSTTSRRISAAMKKANTSIKNLGNAFRGTTKFAVKWGSVLGGVAVAGLTVMVSKSLAAIDNLGKMSRVLGLSTKELAAFELAAEIGGVTLDTFAKSAKNVSKNVFDFVVKGTGEAVDAFRELDITLSDLQPIMNDQTAVMSLLGDRFSEMENGAVKTALAVKLFGSRSADMLNVFETGGGETLRQATKDVELFGNALSQSAVRGVERANDSVTRISFLFKGIRDNITASLAPAIETLVTLFRTKLIQSIQESGGTVESWSKGVANRILDLIQGTMAAINDMVQFAAKVSNEISDFFFGNQREELKQLELKLLKFDARRREAEGRGVAHGLDKLIANLEKKIQQLQKIIPVKGRADEIAGGISDFFDDVSDGIEAIRRALLTGGDAPDVDPPAKKKTETDVKKKTETDVKEKTETDVKETFRSISDAGLKAGKLIRDSFENLALDVRRPIQSIADAIKSTFIGAANKIFSEIVGKLLQKAISNILSDTIVGSFLGFAGGGRTSSPAFVNERGGESLSQGKGLFIPMGGPATIVNAANTRKNGGGGVVIHQNFNIQTGLPEQINAALTNTARRAGADGARLMINAAGGRI